MSPATILTGVLALLCVCAGIRAQDSSEDGDCDFDFDYTAENGPSTWGEKCPACNGDQQSPIDIETSQVQVLNFPTVSGNWSEEYTYTLSNDGYTVTLVVQTPVSLIVQGGPLEGPYALIAVQFCWGSNDSVGSEHTINGERFPLEVQYILKRNGEDGEPDHELRIAQLFRLTLLPNSVLRGISNLLGSIIQPGTQVASTDRITYNTIFFGYPVNNYYYYNGSLTTPPCTEGIKWLVYPPGLLAPGVTHHLMEQFRKLKSENGPLVNNFRPVQELNGRSVVASSKATLLFPTGNSIISISRSGAHSRGRGHAKAANRHH